MEILVRYAVVMCALTLIAGGASCSRSSSPTAPDVIELTGWWSGALPLRTPEAQDWSLARLSLTQSGDILTGELFSRDGARYPVSGTFANGQATLIVGHLPGTSTCAGIQLHITELTVGGGEVQRLAGRAAGRCFGTIAGPFELQRIF